LHLARQVAKIQMKCNPTGDRIPGLTPAIEAGVFVFIEGQPQGPESL